MNLINQDSLGFPSMKLSSSINDILVKKLEDGVVVLGVFNYGTENHYMMCLMQMESLFKKEQQLEVCGNKKILELLKMKQYLH